MKELGYPTVISSSTRGIAGPKGLPAPIVAKLRDVLQNAMADPEHVKKLEDQGIAIKIMVGDEYDKYFADTHAKAKKYTEWAKSRPQK
jgi:tripartite-type tricarboxylate transporter receptor subunit TctC